MKRRLTITAGGGRTANITVLERNEFVVEGDFEFEVEDLDTYVQVKYIDLAMSTGRDYTYRDPGLELQVGDIVAVPVGFTGSARAMVKRLGRGSYRGPIKTVDKVLLRK